MKDSFLNLHIIDGFFRHVQHICQKLPILKTQIEYQVEDKLSRGNSANYVYSEFPNDFRFVSDSDL